MEKKSDETGINGFPNDMELKWDGDFGCTGMTLTVKGLLTESLFQSIGGAATTAGEFFQDLFFQQILDVAKGGVL